MALASEKWAARRSAPRLDYVLLCVSAVVANTRASAEDGPDADYIRARTVAISVEHHDGQDWRTSTSGLGTGFLVHPGGYVLTAKHVAPEELVGNPMTRSKVRVFGRVGDRSSAEMQLQIVDVHPQRDAMLLKFHRKPDRKPFEYFELTDEFTLPLLQVSAAGFPASKDSAMRIITAHMTSDLGEGKQIGEVGAKLEGGFSGGPVISTGKVVGLVESLSTEGQRDTFNFVPIRSLTSWLSDLVIVVHDPPPPTNPPPARVVDMVVGGENHGENKDKNRGFQVHVHAGGPRGNENMVASDDHYCYGGTIKDAPFPTVRLANLTPFEVPTSGYVWVAASQHHDCECSIFVKYTIQTYKWGSYDRKTKTFNVLRDRQATHTLNVPFHFYRGDEDTGKFRTDLTFEGAN